MNAFDPAPYLRVLLVEDDIELAGVMAECLQLLGYRVTVAHDIGGALRTDAADFDLLVSDLDLPDGSGLDLRPLLGLPGVILSGSADERDVDRSREAGFAAFLTKPVALERLDAVLRRVARAATGVMCEVAA